MKANTLSLLTLLLLSPSCQTSLRQPEAPDSAVEAGAEDALSAPEAPEAAADVEALPLLGTSPDSPATSCLALHQLASALPSGIYWTLRADGATPTAVWCDMEEDGGGWTRLTNPRADALPPWHPDLQTQGWAYPGTGSCAPTPQEFMYEAEWGLRAYVCGNDGLQLEVTWSGAEPLTEVRFRATAQGTAQHDLSLNNQPRAPDRLTGEPASCACWNGEAAAAAPAPNECWATVVDAAPHRATLAEPSVTLSLTLITGPSCSPDCAYGTGANLIELSVR